MQNDRRTHGAGTSALTHPVWSRCICAILIVSTLSIYQRGVLSSPAKIARNHWQSIVSEDFAEITHQYDTDAVLIWNDHNRQNTYLGAQIGDYWQLFFRKNAIETYTVKSFKRDRRTIKAKIIATARSSKGAAEKIYISHKIDVDSRGKITKEVWITDRRK